MMRRSLNALRHAVVHLHGIGDAELGLAAADHGNDHLVARGRLHQHVEGGPLLEHLGDRRRGGVVERRGLQRGEAVGLRRRRGRSERQRRAGRDGDRRPAPRFTDSARHAIPLLCLVRWRASAGILACRPPQGEAQSVAPAGRLPSSPSSGAALCCAAIRLSMGPNKRATTFVRPMSRSTPVGLPWVPALARIARRDVRERAFGALGRDTRPRVPGDPGASRGRPGTVRRIAALCAAMLLEARWPIARAPRARLPPPVHPHGHLFTIRGAASRRHAIAMAPRRGTAYAGGIAVSPTRHRLP